jgi:hypothetical protein
VDEELKEGLTEEKTRGEGENMGKTLEATMRENREFPL